jgi:uncharacterized protein
MMTTEIDYAAELADIATAYQAAGGDPSDLHNTDGGLLLVSGHNVLASSGREGLTMESEAIEDGVRVRVKVSAGAKLTDPVHLCFGMIPKEGLQRIVADFVLEPGAQATFLAHCTFPNAVKVDHIMEGTVHVGPGARMEYSETHYHGTDGGVNVLPTMHVEVAAGGTYISTFSLIKGAAGRVKLDYDCAVADAAVVELYAKIYGKREDRITVRESIRLLGEEARGLARSRIVASDRAWAEVQGEIEGVGNCSRGHVDCVEIVKGKDARASAVPLLRVLNDSAKLTHEAAIGSVDRGQVQTLMARGLTEQTATDIIVRGLLK